MRRVQATRLEFLPREARHSAQCAAFRAAPGVPALAAGARWDWPPRGWEVWQELTDRCKACCSKPMGGQQHGLKHSGWNGTEVVRSGKKQKQHCAARLQPRRLTCASHLPHSPPPTWKQLDAGCCRLPRTTSRGRRRKRGASLPALSPTLDLLHIVARAVHAAPLDHLCLHSKLGNRCHAVLSCRKNTQLTSGGGHHLAERRQPSRQRPQRRQPAPARLGWPSPVHAACVTLRHAQWTR